MTMKDEETLSSLVKGQIELEKKIAEKLRKLEQRVDSVAARLLIREMQLDTRKHAEILEEVSKLIGAPKSLWDYTIHIDADKRAVRKELEEHVKAEEKMMKQIEREAGKTEDEALRLLLGNFAEDEKKHHRYLETILDKVYKIEL